MKTAACRDFNRLNRDFLKKVNLWFNEVNKKEKVIFATETWRSEQRQAELVKAKLSYVKHSNHQDGVAIDIGFYGSELYPSDISKWRKVADIAKKYGIDWGFDLWEWDKPHFQDNGKQILNVNKPIMSKYSDVMSATLKELNFAPVFSDHKGDTPLTEQETKELIEISLARFAKRYNLK